MGILLCSTISGCGDTTINSIQKNTQIQDITVVDFVTVQEMIQNEESFILYIGRDDCLDCRNFEPILKEYLKKNDGSYIYYLDIKKIRKDAISNDATTKQIKLYEQLQKTLDFDWTPTIHYYDQGKITKSYEYLSKAYYKIDDQKLLKEEKRRYIDEFYEFIHPLFK